MPPGCVERAPERVRTHVNLRDSLGVFGCGLACFSLVLSIGCARAKTVTTLNPNGTFSRSTTYTMPAAAGGLGALGSLGTPAEGGEKPQEQPATKPEDVFKVPPQSAGVKVTSATVKGDTTVTVSREAPFDTTLDSDIVLWEKKGKPMLSSSVAVKKLADGNIEYTETLHWLGKPSKNGPTTDPDIRLKVKNVIPQALQQTEAIDKATKAVAVNLVHAMFGPPEPMLANFFMDPDGAMRRVNTRILPMNAQTFRSVMPSLTEAEAVDMSKRLSMSVMLDPNDQSPLDRKPASGEGESSSDNSLCTLYFEVAFPGTIVETNGLVDVLDGRVYWSLLAAGVELEDVVLRAVVKPK